MLIKNTLFCYLKLPFLLFEKAFFDMQKSLFCIMKKAFLFDTNFIIENLDLEKVRPGKYFLLAQPLKIGGAEAAPVRAVLLADFVFWSGSKA